MNTSGSPSARITTYCAVHGPMPGSCWQLHRQLVAIGAEVDVDPSLGDGRAHTARAIARGHGASAATTDRARRGPPPRGTAAGPMIAALIGQRPSPSPTSAARRPATVARPGHRHLLPDDRPHHQLGPVDAARRAQPRPLRDERAEQRVGAQLAVDRHRIGVEVEQSAASLHRGLQIGERIEPQRARHGTIERTQCHHAGTVGQSQRPSVRRAVPRLDTGHDPSAEEREHRLRIERCPDRQPHRDRTGATRRGRHGRDPRGARDGGVARAARSATWRTPRGRCR